MPSTTNIRSNRALRRSDILSRPEVKSVRASRSTGTLISVSDVNLAPDGQYGIAADRVGGTEFRWVARCEDHGQIKFASTRRLARAAGIEPRAWCNRCLELPTTTTADGADR